MAFVDADFGVRALGDRTDSSGTSVLDFTAREDALPHEVLAEGIVKPDGGFEVSADGSGMHVTVGSGSAYRDLAVVVSTEDQQPPYIVQLREDSVQVDFDASGSSDRVDSVFLVVEDDTWDSSGRRLPRLAYLVGTEGAGAPDPDPAWHAWLRLADVDVAAGASEIVADDVTDRRTDSAIRQHIMDESVRQTDAAVFGDVLDGRYAADPHGDAAHSADYASDPHGDAEHDGSVPASPHGDSDHNYTAGMVLLDTVELGSAGAIEFTSIPSGYRHLKIVVSGARDDSNAARIALRLNDDAGSNYSWVIARFEDASRRTDEDTSATEMEIGWLSDSEGAAEIVLTGYGSGQRTRVMATSFTDGGSGLYIAQGGGWWSSTAAVTKVRITVSGVGSDDIAAGTIASLYGMA